MNLQSLHANTHCSPKMQLRTSLLLEFFNNSKHFVTEIIYYNFLRASTTLLKRFLLKNQFSNCLVRAKFCPNILNITYI